MKKNCQALATVLCPFILWAQFAVAQPSQTVGGSAIATTDVMIPARDHELSGRLFAPAGMARFPVVVIVSGSGNESELDGIYNHLLAQAFTRVGISVLVYDKRGVGRSGGAYTGVDFPALGEDAAAVARYAGRLPQAEAVGMWGISQAGWIVPYAVRHAPELRFVILVSPAGINAFEQISYFLRNQALGWGLSAPEADAADRMHRAVTLYYAGRASYQSAQSEVDRHHAARWFHRVITDPYWDEMTPAGRILDPEQLAQALRERPLAFEAYRARTSYIDFRQAYRSLRRLSTLIVYGADDQNVPPLRSRPLFETALRDEQRHHHDFLMYEGAGHDITTPDGRVAPHYLEAMTSWARKRVDEASVACTPN
jgi:dienelactone hydrolase